MLAGNFGSAGFSCLARFQWALLAGLQPSPVWLRSSLPLFILFGVAGKCDLGPLGALGSWLGLLETWVPSVGLGSRAAPWVPVQGSGSLSAPQALLLILVAYVGCPVCMLSPGVLGSLLGGSVCWGWVLAPWVLGLWAPWVLVLC